MSESTNLTVSQARRIILRIAKRKGWVEQRIREKTDQDTLDLLESLEGVREELGDVVETIARDIGSRRARFILELVQNAEDNKFDATNKPPTITFEVIPDRIVVECNENGFTESNVISICRTGRSSKTSNRGYIGEKGIGFKSVFQVASKVHIQSNSFSFSFHYDGGTTSEAKLGIVTPISEDEVIPPDQRPFTRMTLTPIRSIPYSDLVNQFNDIPDDLLLFLSTLQEIKIKIHDSDRRISTTTFRKLEDSAAGTVKLTKIIQNTDDQNEMIVKDTCYRITKRELVNLPVDNVRLDIHECEAVLAFPVNKASQPLISPQKIFAFLPIRDFGFHFLIQADFIVEASRQDVVDSPRNKEILLGVAKTFCDAVMGFCTGETPLRYQWMRYLPSARRLDSFWRTLPSNIVSILQEKDILYPQGSSRAQLPRRFRTLSTNHLDLSRRPLFEDLARDRMYLSLEYDSRDIQILRESFDLHEIEDEDLYYRIRQDLESPLSRMKAVDMDGRKVNSRLKPIYFPSDDEYGPQQLLKAVSHPRNPTVMVPRCLMPFLDPGYLNLFPVSNRRGELSWLDWLEKALGVRNVPRLKADGGSLSGEFRHIIAYQPEKLVGTLKKYWEVYRNEIDGGRVIDDLSQAEVPCYGNRVSVLQKTYAPLPSLKGKVQSLGVVQGFPFLKLTGGSEEIQIRRDWRFLEEFRVRFEAGLEFYVEILRQHESRSQRAWDNVAQSNILRTYEAIADHCNNSNRDWIRQILDDEFLILDPCAFEPTASTPSWTDIDSCVWIGAENLLDKKPLAAVPQYRTNEKLTRFFRHTLDIKNANWTDYLRVLSNMKNNSDPAQGILDKASRLYNLLSEVASGRDRTAICNAFEEDCLVFVPSTEEKWFPPSKCLWNSPVHIDGRAIIQNSYSEDFGAFFLNFLNISPASLSTLVLELQSLARGRPSIPRVTQLIWAVNAMNPSHGDLDTLFASNILPIKTQNQGPNHIIALQSSETDFVVVDRNNIAQIFGRQAAFLDFTLEEVLQLHPFLQALGLRNKYLSLISEEETICEDEGVIDSNLTTKFKERAYDLLRCAFSFQSPLARSNARALYDSLLNASVRKSDTISTKHTLHLASGDISVLVSEGYVHVIAEQDTITVFVPNNRKERELCYIRNLPNALTKAFQISQLASKVIGHVLNTNLFVIDALLDAEGIGKISDIPPPLRSLSEEEEEEEVLATEEATASSRNSQARSASLLTSRNPLDQDRSSPGSALESRDSVSGLAETDQHSSSSTTTSNYRATPASSDFRERDIRFSPVPAHQFARSPTPEYVQPENITRSTAYRELLDNVIRIAGQTNLPHRNFVQQAGYGQVHQGFDHEEAFGVRPQAQMSHDTKIGAAGELFVFEILLRLLQPSFGRDNWKSTIRKEVTVHPRYSDLAPWRGVETADIVYKDSNSALTELLVEQGYLEDVWTGARPQYLIEVKTTTGECNDRFFMSNSQYLRMQRMALSPGRTAAEVYIICRVYNLTKNSINMRLYVDPEADRRRNALVFDTQSWTVTPR